MVRFLVGLSRTTNNDLVNKTRTLVTRLQQHQVWTKTITRFELNV